MKNAPVWERAKVIVVTEEQRKQIQDEENQRIDTRNERRAGGCLSIVLAVIVITVIAFMVSRFTG